jgi:hypothetical protein
MFINKWLVIDSVNDMLDNDWKDGFCLDLSHEPGDMRDLYLILQRLPDENPFAILLSEKTMAQKVNDSYFENIMALFFQPSYFLDFDVPVIFLNNKATSHAGFVETLTAKCMNQGLPVLLFKTKDIRSVEKPTTHVYEVRSADVDHNAIVEKWLSQYLEHKDPSEIHFLFAKDQPGLTGILQKMQQGELELYNTQVYKYASLFYDKQKMFEGYKRELDAMVSVEHDTRVYLTMQKKQTADNVEWYYNEYEILPTWYKRVGHIIKVLMGKRTFRSLFSDKVKKYKD